MPEQPATLIPAEPAGNAYRVLARKYRPTSFRQLIGQEAMVRTLTNAIASGRLAHAFVLTGVRGIGKTTTARIIARGLNCVGADGQGQPTADPCGVCEHCRAIAEDRHVDVLEMDAASRTGVNDIRELIEGVRYRPVSARYKVYIIDEIHMLSTNAFNALLKTLEEPPAHVKFVFATTEARKIPVTVLSRCQRFDLRRVEADVLAAHFGRIAEAEGAAIAPTALALIARAADGSVRDGLSLLDQAIALANGPIGEQLVRDMLGLADRSQLFDLYDQLMRGDAAGALGLVATLYAAGADPASLVQDLLDLTHWLTRLKLAPAAADLPTVPETERVRGKEMSGRLGMGQLTRAWQMLLKGLAEVQQAPAPLQALEMLLVRLTHAAELPSPAALVEALASGKPLPGMPAAPRPTPDSPARRDDGARNGAPVLEAASPPREPMLPVGDGPRAALAAAQPAAAAAPAPGPAAQAAAEPRSFAELVTLFAERREMILHAHLHGNVHLVHFEPGRLELRPTDQAPPNLANRVGKLLLDWTGRRWVVAISAEEGQPTLAQQHATAEDERRRRAAEHPLVRAVLASFPGAAIEAVRSLDLPPAEPSPAEDTP
jgi:DNA polymerase-3 subunit gamma/tau